MRPPHNPKEEPMEYCDNCAKELDVQTRCAVESLNVDIASANKGESATLCPTCCLADALTKNP